MAAPSAACRAGLGVPAAASMNFDRTTTSQPKARGVAHIVGEGRHREVSHDRCPIDIMENIVRGYDAPAADDSPVPVDCRRCCRDSCRSLVVPSADRAVVDDIVGGHAAAGGDQDTRTLRSPAPKAGGGVASSQAEIMDDAAAHDVAALQMIETPSQPESCIYGCRTTEIIDLFPRSARPEAPQ